MIVLSYVDDCILIAKDEKILDKFIQSLTDGPETFIFTDEGSMSSYLVLDITCLSDGSGFVMAQPFLIEGIIKALNFDPSTTKGANDNVPATLPLLSKDLDGPQKKAA